MNQIPILLWIYYNDLADEFVNILSSVKNRVSIYLGLCYDNYISDNHDVVQKFKSADINIADIEYYGNKGADIQPFIRQLAELDPVKYPFFIKMHSKKSNYGYRNRCCWRSVLIDSLISDESLILNNNEYIVQNSFGSLGCLSLIKKETQSVHSQKMKEISEILGLSIPNKYSFVGGNMFLGNTRLYQNYLTTNEDALYSLLSKETGKVNENRNGTYCHAMERIIGCIANNNGGLAESLIDYLPIQIPDASDSKDTKYIHLRITYNNHVYCVENINIYGFLQHIENDKSSFSVLWKNDSEDTLATYRLLSNNTYINTRHL